MLDERGAARVSLCVRQRDMKSVVASLLALALVAGCGTSKQAGGPTPTAPKNKVVVFRYGDPENAAAMRFHLKGPYGIVLRHYSTSAAPSGVTYELFSEQNGRVLATQDQFEFKRALEGLPASAKVDFYDTCTVSLSSETEKNVLQYCDEIGIAGVRYVMCTDLGSIGKPRPWRWKREAEPSGPANGSQPIRSETNRTSSAAGSRR